MLMGTMLRIESEEAYAIASELAGLTGESLTTVVTEALRARLHAKRRQRDHDAHVRRTMEIAASIRSHMDHPLPTSDLSDLYDANGLPV